MSAMTSAARLEVGPVQQHVLGVIEQNDVDPATASGTHRRGERVDRESGAPDLIAQQGLEQPVLLTLRRAHLPFGNRGQHRDDPLSHLSQLHRPFALHLGAQALFADASSTQRFQGAHPIHRGPQHDGEEGAGQQRPDLPVEQVEGLQRSPGGDQAPGQGDRGDDPETDPGPADASTQRDGEQDEVAGVVVPVDESALPPHQRLLEHEQGADGDHHDDHEHAPDLEESAPRQNGERGGPAQEHERQDAVAVPHRRAAREHRYHQVDADECAEQRPPRPAAESEDGAAARSGVGDVLGHGQCRGHGAIQPIRTVGAAAELGVDGRVAARQSEHPADDADRDAEPGARNGPPVEADAVVEHQHGDAAVVEVHMDGSFCAPSVGIGVQHTVAQRLRHGLGERFGDLDRRQSFSLELVAELGAGCDLGDDGLQFPDQLGGGHRLRHAVGSVPFDLTERASGLLGDDRASTPDGRSEKNREHVVVDEPVDATPLARASALHRIPARLELRREALGVESATQSSRGDRQADEDPAEEQLEQRSLDDPEGGGESAVQKSIDGHERPAEPEEHPGDPRGRGDRDGRGADHHQGGHPRHVARRRDPRPLDREHEGEQPQEVDGADDSRQDPERRDLAGP